MTRYSFTVKDVAREVRKLAVERPDFVYTNQLEDSYNGDCSYLTAGHSTPLGEGCIVGQALQRLGVSEYDLKSVEGTAAHSVVNLLVDVRTPVGNMDSYWLGLIQMYQDEGASWGKALELADSAM